ncbi:hypothetical protein PanWU01x14_296650 [Parasponia andersonii]|uniref:Uncharacterized protein n=1 Tax=Parasponia andersonii TaxID=3476 RepID=A0A2P5AVG1_PARAD|nr:hypothetical protein PanWU01x14_296650 [Parasponia andersonii]
MQISTFKQAPAPGDSVAADNYGSNQVPAPSNSVAAENYGLDWALKPKFHNDYLLVIIRKFAKSLNLTVSSLSTNFECARTFTKMVDVSTQVAEGIAEYSGSPVLQMPIKEAGLDAVQRIHSSKRRFWKYAQARQQAKGQSLIPVLQINKAEAAWGPGTQSIKFDSHLLACRSS